MADVPDNAPKLCPGTRSEKAGEDEACSGCPNQSVCASAPKGPDPAIQEVKERLYSVKHKVIVLSGKGGVGKSTFTAHLAHGLAADQNRQIAVLDVDICGPSMPRILGVEGEQVHQSGSGWSPVYVDDNLSVMSVGFLLTSPDEAVIWRGPKKNEGATVAHMVESLRSGYKLTRVFHHPPLPNIMRINAGHRIINWFVSYQGMSYRESGVHLWLTFGPSLIKQFLRDVDWGEVDYLVIDTPPGTSDEHLSVVQYLSESKVDGAVVVTTPQELSLLDVRKEISFCRKVGLPIIGVVENMSGFICPKCKNESQIFPPTTGGGEKMASDMKVPFLGRLPLDPRIGKCCDEGKSFLTTVPDSPATHAFIQIIDKIVKHCEANEEKTETETGEMDCS